MLVERREYLDSARAVVYLVQRSPQKRRPVASSMPPIKNERADKPADETLSDCWQCPSQMKEGRPLKPPRPGIPSNDYDSELRCIEQDRSCVPTRRVR